MKILVVYFSRSGNTTHVAEDISWYCGADRERIRERHGRDGVSGWLRSWWQAVARRRPPILPGRCNPADYDLVVIGTPVWAKAPAAPVRSYVCRHAGQFKRVAFFCTRGHHGAQQAFAELQRLCGQAPVAQIAFDAMHSGVPAAGESLRRFMARMGLQV